MKILNYDFTLKLNSKEKFEKKPFFRDPVQTELGRKIIEQGIIMINEIGFEEFNFKKLASRLDTAESSMYRYFASKHIFLIYLITWYWSWVNFNIEYQINNLKDPEKQLKVIIKVLCRSSQYDHGITYLDESLLHRIIITESSKAYITQYIEKESKEGLFESYKEICKKISDLIILINPDYPNPKALANSMINILHKQLFYSVFMQDITDQNISEGETSGIEGFAEHLIFSALSKDSQKY